MAENIYDYAGKHVHMLGIGGSSMSGLAWMLKEKGFTVTGSDKTRSHKTDHLEEIGIPVEIGHKAEYVHGADVIVYSAAIPDSSPERTEAKRLGIPQIERCDLIGALMKGSTFAVGVSGTHGKTTVTSMLAQTFLSAGADPTVHIGGELDYIGGSTRIGHTGDFICEACEFRESFLHFKPTVAVITNIDEDHLDYFGDIEHIEDAFRKYTLLLPESGRCIAWGDDARSRRVCENAPCGHLTYGLNKDNNLTPENLLYDETGHAEFDAVMNGVSLGHFKIGVPGEVNMLNALAAIAVCYVRGLDMSKTAKALEEFAGAHRRCELTGVTDGVRCFTDYGHNPSEMENALKIISAQPHKELWSVFQPHTFSRAKTLFNQFLDVFSLADHVLITDIDPARETDPGDIHASMFVQPLLERGVDAVYTGSFDATEDYLRKHWKSGDVMISHSCGSIYLLNEQIAAHGDTEREG